jgi:hypothetical protein
LFGDGFKRIKGLLLVEMELYFGCLIRKQVCFYERDAERRFQPVTDEVRSVLCPVVTQRCSLDGDTPPPVAGLDIQHERAYVPKWLRIHYRNGEREGRFGY